MHRALESLGGGILGFLVGSFLCSPLIAHVFGPTTVSWDASACPVGLYTITSTATGLNGGRTFTATTQQVQLPRTSFVHDFGEIPIGQYEVTATARDAAGRAFGSDRQIVSGQGPIPTPTPTPTPPPPPIPGVPDPPTVSTPRRNRGHQGASTPTVPDAFRAPSKATTTAATAPAVSASMLARILADIGVQDLLATFPSWKSIALLDTDDNGSQETVRIEWITGLVFYFVVNQ